VWHRSKSDRYLSLRERSFCASRSIPLNANPHLAAEPLVLGPPASEATAAAIVVHGRGHGPETMVDLVRLLALDDVHYVLPAAAGQTWYPNRFIAPLAANEPWLSWALDALAATVERLAEARRLVLVGFSQGGCLTLEYVARHPRRYDGVAGLVGGLIGTDEELTRPTGLDGTPLLITTIEGDAWVPADRTRASAAILTEGGADVDLRVFPPAPHTLHQEEVDAVRALLRA
jgi:phospholipase/carboxylesterase